MHFIDVRHNFHGKFLTVCVIFVVRITCEDKSQNGHYAKWTLCKMDIMQNGHYAMDIMQNGHYAMDIMQNGHYAMDIMQNGHYAMTYLSTCKLDIKALYYFIPRKRKCYEAWHLISLSK